jgi:chaperonin GroEL
LPGGGIALTLCADSSYEEDYDNADQELGASIVSKALYAPFMTILKNAGVDDHYRILSEINKNRVDSDDPNWEGYDVKNSEYVNLFDKGILDPTKVTRTAIENASSVAGTILTTESVIYTVSEDKKEEIDYSQFMQ